MAIEPVEAALSRPPALSRAQEEQLRELEIEGPTLTAPSPAVLADNEKRDDIHPPTLPELEAAFTRKGYQIVKFEPGLGEDPREFGWWKKWFITLSTSFFCFSVALGSAIITGDLEGPREELHTRDIIINLTVTCFVIGFGIGPLFFAPLSEVIGRKPVYCLSMFFYFIFTLPSALAKNTATLVVSRQIAGLAASAPVTNVGGSIADIWDVNERGVPMAIFSTTLFMGPCIGPLVGGWIGERAGWRWIYWVLFIFTGLSFGLSLFVPETLAPVILRKKAERLRKGTGDPNIYTLEELERKPFSERMKVAMLRPMVMMVKEPILFFMTIYLSFIYTLLYLMFFAFPIAFEEIRGFGLGMTGVTFISIMIGIGLAMATCVPIQERIYAKKTINGAYPEARLYLMMAGAILLPMALFVFAFTGAYAKVHWIAPNIAGGMFGFSFILVYVSANSYIVDSYSSYAASAMAAKTFVRSEIGAMVPLYVQPMFHNMGFQYAGLTLAMIGVGIGPIAFIFFFWGEKIRMVSSRANKTKRVRQ